MKLLTFVILLGLVLPIPALAFSDIECINKLNRYGFLDRAAIACDLRLTDQSVANDANQCLYQIDNDTIKRAAIRTGWQSFDNMVKTKGLSATCLELQTNFSHCLSK